MKTKLSRRKEITEIRIEISEIDYQNNKKINKTKSWYIWV